MTRLGRRRPLAPARFSSFAAASALLLVLPASGAEPTAEPAPIFADGFESGDYFEWSGARVGSSDETPPELAILSPARVLYNQPSPALELSFADADEGIAPGSFRLELDGVDLSAGCTVGESGASCPPPTLTPGAHRLSVVVWDRAGNRSVVERDVHLVLDVTAPELAITEPIFDVLYRPTISVRATFLDFESGVVRDSVRVHLDGNELSPTCGLSFTSVVCDPRTLFPGLHEVEVEALDAAGNRSTARHVFSLADDGTPPTLTVSTPEART